MGVPCAPSAVQTFINSYLKHKDHGHDVHLNELTLQIAHNLRYQHGWVNIRIYHETSKGTNSGPLPRPLISGLPPRRLYVHPDEQIELLQKQKDEGKSGMPDLELEREWVLPSHLREKWSLRRFGEVFDVIPPVSSDTHGGALFQDHEQSSEDIDHDPTAEAAAAESEMDTSLNETEWRTAQPKRILLATLDDDSTITYYIVHDGLVKPRQN